MHFLVNASDINAGMSLVSHALSVRPMRQVYEGVTTDVAIRLIDETGYTGVWDKIAEAAKRYCTLRVRGEIRIDVMVVQNDGRILGQCMEEEP